MIEYKTPLSIVIWHRLFVASTVVIIGLLAFWGDEKSASGTAADTAGVTPEARTIITQSHRLTPMMAGQPK